MAEKRKWSDKFKLAMGELENKIQREHRGRTAGAWPEPEKVEAWNAERQRQRGCGQYCGSVSAAERTQTKEEHKRELFLKNVAVQTAKSAAFLLAAVASVILRGSGAMGRQAVIGFWLFWFLGLGVNFCRYRRRRQKEREEAEECIR